MEIRSINQKLPPTDYDKFGLNRLGLNKNGGYGLCQPEADGYTCDLTKDYLRDLKFQQRGFQVHNQLHSIIENKFKVQESHSYLPGAFSALKTIIANDVFSLITGGAGQSLEYPNYPNDLTWKF